MRIPLSYLCFHFLTCITRVNADDPATPAPARSIDREELERKWGTDWAFSGISTFAHLRYVKCLTDPDTPFDIAVLGAPFDGAVSYRGGARSGPRAIRAASARQLPFRGFSPRASINPFTSWATLLDCGDIPIAPFDNALALRQMSTAFLELGQRLPTASSLSSSSPYQLHPKLITLGGDHSIALPALRALNKIYNQPVAVVHFDAHLDTWHPAKYPSAWFDTDSEEMQQSFFNHGSMFWLGAREGLIRNGSSIHAGLRTRLSDEGDNEDDDRQGWVRIAADDIDNIGTSGVVGRIMERVGTDVPVYLSIDIVLSLFPSLPSWHASALPRLPSPPSDPKANPFLLLAPKDVIDPGLAPGTGTPEPGGWTTRELIRILRGIEGLNVVGADIVEVSPPYDGTGEATALAAAQMAYEVLTSMVKRGLVDMGIGRTEVVGKGKEGKGSVGMEGGRDEL